LRIQEDTGTPVTEDYKEGDNKFSGTIHQVVIEVAPRKLTDAQPRDFQKALIAIAAAE
jgi:hypothetical protein